MSKVIRIQEDAEAIALSYGSSVSEGIRTMEKLLKKANSVPLKLATANFPSAPYFTEKPPKETAESSGKYTFTFGKDRSI